MYSFVVGTGTSALDFTPAGFLAGTVSTDDPDSYDDVNHRLNFPTVSLFGVEATVASGSEVPVSDAGAYYFLKEILGESSVSYYVVSRAQTVDSVHFLDSGVVFSNEFGSGGSLLTINQILGVPVLDLLGGAYWADGSNLADHIQLAAAGGLALGNDNDDLLLGASGTDNLQGGAGADTLFGYGGADEMHGDAGNDTLMGGDGADFGFAGEGNDSVDGGAGDDTLMGYGGTDTLAGNDGMDVLFGGLDGDQLDGGMDDDFMDGEDGADTLTGAGGDDDMRGGASTDSLNGGIGNDSLQGGDENDTLAGAGGDDFMKGDAGRDKLVGGDGDDELQGGLGNDTLDGGDGNDELDDEDSGGADRMLGRGGNDEYVVDNLGDITDETGGSGHDVVWLLESIGGWELGAGLEDLNYFGHSVTLLGNADNNVIKAAPGFVSGNDTIDGMEGNDTIGAAGGADSLMGGDGDDSLQGGAGNDILLGEAGNDTLEGGAGNDRLVAGPGNDLLLGGDGNDTLDGRADGTDTLRGGAGDDVYQPNSGDVIDDNQGVDIIKTTFIYTVSGNVGEVRIIGPGVRGGSGNDFLVGDSNANKLLGMDGNDTINGMAGNDTLSGGTGADAFVFSTALNSASNKDLISDFQHLTDKIWLDDDIFKALGPVAMPTPLAGAQFFVGTAAHDSSDRIIYDRDTGALYYDPDGTGTAAAKQFATLGGGLTHPALTAADIVIVT